MSGVELVAAALTAGATAGLTDTAHAAVHDAYTRLVSAVRHRLGRDDREDAVLDEHASDPIVRHEQLVAVLTSADAGEDTELVAAARRLLTQIDPLSVQGGKYVVDLREAKGVQIGDNPTMTLHF
ncbi:MAG: hypothetical protein M3Y48_17280 [Actinomycetota bacterium]|nr:hypothetical protein [Actinomycetota bacterium]